jgi:PilZ domain-containing protein
LASAIRRIFLHPSIKRCRGGPALISRAHAAEAVPMDLERPGPPLPGGDVSLVIPDREMLRARVDDLVDGAVDLAVLQAQHSPYQHTTSYVEFVGAEGLWRYVGRYQPLDRPAYTDPKGVRQVVRFTYAGPPQLMQRREFIRADHVAQVNLFKLDDEDAIAEAGWSINVSGGGLLVRGFGHIAVGDRLHVDMMLESGGPRIVAEACVVRVTAEDHHGIQFTEIADVDRDGLVEFAYHIERARREMAISR